MGSRISNMEQRPLPPVHAWNCQIHRESSTLSLKSGTYSVVVVWVKRTWHFIGIWKLHRLAPHSHTSKSQCWSKEFPLPLLFLSSPKVSCLGHSIAFSSSILLASGSTRLKFSQHLRSTYHRWLLILESLVLNGNMTQPNRQSVRWTLAWPDIKQDFLCFWKLKKKCAIAAIIWYKIPGRPPLHV